MSMNVWGTPVATEEHVKIYAASSNVIAQQDMLVNCAVSTLEIRPIELFDRSYLLFDI